MAGSPRNSVGNVRSDMDITYPEHLSRLHRHSLLAEYPKSFFKKEKKLQNRRGNRYRTQPVTFGEIQEVDEENMLLDSPPGDDEQPMPAPHAASKLNFDLFRFAKATGPKRKKPNPAEIDMLPADVDVIDQTNGDDGMKALRPKPMDQMRWTDYAREGSV